MTEEQIKWFKKWILELRTTKLNQAKGLLLTRDSACCLGIAAQMSDVPYRWDETERHYEIIEVANFKFPERPASLQNTKMVCPLWWREKTGLPFEVAQKFASMNDRGVPFSEIALEAEEYIRPYLSPVPPKKPDDTSFNGQLQ